MHMSLPSRMTFALPGMNGVSSEVMMSLGGRAMRMYTGPSISTAARTAFFSSSASQGTKICMFGSTRISAISSMLWWLPPSSPVLIPAWHRPNFTFAFT